MTNQPGEVKTVFDNRGQYERIVPYVIPGETLLAVYDLKGKGTGFIGITDQRVIFYDENNVITTGNNKRTMIWIPYNRIIAVAAGDEGHIFQTSELVLLTAAGKFSFEFRGKEKAQWVYQYITNQILNQPSPQLRG